MPKNKVPERYLGERLSRETVRRTIVETIGTEQKTKNVVLAALDHCGGNHEEVEAFQLCLMILDLYCAVDDHRGLLAISERIRDRRLVPARYAAAD